jgi:hypothetical protein
MCIKKLRKGSNSNKTESSQNQFKCTLLLATNAYDQFRPTLASAFGPAFQSVHIFLNQDEVFHRLNDGLPHLRYLA